MTRQRLLYGLAFVACLAPTNFGRADDPWPVQRGPSREPAPYRYDARLTPKIPREFLENAPACVLYAATSHRVEPDGTVETTSHEVTRLNGRKGIDNLGEYHHIYYDPHFQKLTLNVARIHKPGGRVVEIEPRHVQLRDVATDYLIYDHSKQLVLSFPNLEVGDVYEVKWTVRGKNPEFAPYFFTRYSLGDDTYPVVLDELHVLVPKDVPFHHATVNGKLKPKIKDVGELKHYHWKVKHRPQLEREEDRPSLEELRLQVSCSTFPDWEAVAKWKQKLRAECWTCTPEIRKIVERVTARHTTDLDKARALTYWVRRQIRYVSRGPGGLGYTPHLPHQVLANLYGDCKDQAQLLAVMLKEIGLPVYLVTLGTLDDGQVLKEVPSPWGTHAILMVKIAGKDHWIDTTVTQAGWDYLPRSDRNRQAYLTRDGELLLLRTPPFTADDQRYEQTSDVYVRGDGSSTTRRQSNYHGGAGLSRRDVWLETPLGERRRLITQELQDAHSRSRLLALHIDDRNLLDFDRPVEASLEFQITRHFTGDEALEGSLTDSVVWNRLLAYNLDPDRLVAMQLPGPFSSTHRYRVMLPATLRFDGLPSSYKITSRWGFHALDVKQDPQNSRIVDLIMHTRLDRDRIDPVHFAEYHKFHEEVSKSYRVWLNVKPTHELADAPLLETLLALAPGCDRQAAELLAKIYHDNDRNDDARRVLDAMLFYQPRAASLWELKLKSADTHADEEKVHRTLVELFPQEPRYQLGLGTWLVKRRQHEPSRKVLEPLLSNKSDSLRARVHYQLARSFHDAKQYQASLKHLAAARVADASVVDNARAWHFEAQVEEKLGNKRAALDAYRKALAFEERALYILEDLIHLLLPDADNKDTLEMVRRYTLLAQDASSLVQAAEYHFRLGRLEDAFELANRSRDKVFTAKAQRILGLIRVRQGELTQGIFHLARADQDAEVVEALVRAHLSLGQLHLAELRLGVLETSTPALDKLRDRVSTLAARREELLKSANLPQEKKAANQRVVDAFVCADDARRRGDEASRVARVLEGAFAEEGVLFGPAFALRGLLHLEQGKIGLARADADQALRLGPPDSLALFVRGRVRLLRGDRTAIGDLEQAARLSEQRDPRILHWLAAAQFQAGERDKAFATQKQAVALASGDEELRAQLREFEKRPQP